MRWVLGMDTVSVVVCEIQSTFTLSQSRIARAPAQSGCARQRKGASTLGLTGLTSNSPTTMFSSNSGPLPPRTHSINAVKHANYFGSIDEELRDCKRVQRQGQEEDLREALSRMMARVEEMVRSRWDYTNTLCYCGPLAHHAD